MKSAFTISPLPGNEMRRFLTIQEVKFLNLACSDLTYVQIASLMNLSPRTVDGYREVLFEKLGVKSRVTMALWAVKTGVVSL